MRTHNLFTTALLLLALGNSKVMAQATTTENDAATAAAPTPVSHTPSIGITAGTSGIGLQGIYPLDAHFSLRGGFSIIPTFTYTHTDQVGTTALKQQFKTGFVNLHVLADYYLPVLRKAGFRLSGGLAWFVQAKSDVRSIPVGDYFYGDIQINDERMGEISTVVKRNGIAPYLGLGFLNLYSSRHINLSFDLGSYCLLPEAHVKMEATGYLTGNERNQQQLKQNLKDYRWLPVAQIGVYYKL